MMLVMVLVLSALLAGDVAAHVALNRTLKNGQPETETETDDNQHLGKHSLLEIGSCANGWIYFGYCYKFFPQTKTWIDAELYCQALAPGGHLASIHWEQQNKFIGEVIAATNKLFPRTWIGLSDIHKVWSFLWADGSSFDFMNFVPNQPDDYQGKEKCVQMNVENTNKWNDVPCDYQYPFVCSYKIPCR